MPSERLPLLLFVGFGVFSIFYQTIGRNLWVQIGYGNTLQPLSDFPYTCRRLNDPEFEACEDMWLSEGTRQLFLACSDSMARKEWLPNLGRLNATGRSRKDKLIVMDIDKPAGTSFAHRTLATPNYPGLNGDGLLSLIAITGLDNNGAIDLYLNNQLPTVDPITRQPVDNTQTGANATVEIFRVTNPQTATAATHITTYHDAHIATPNRVAPTANSAFYLTNDHGTNRVGLWHQLSPIIKTGDVSYCPAPSVSGSPGGACKRVEKGLAMPNGLWMGRQDGLLYVPSTASGRISVYRPSASGDGELKLIEEIRVGVPLDNISEDAEGVFWVAAIPKLLNAMPVFDDPLREEGVPTTVFKISRRTEKGKTGYVIQKALEDGRGEVLPLVTTVVHDAKTGRLFVGSVVKDFIAVCERK